jgi:tRNA modification GTPase
VTMATSSPTRRLSTLDLPGTTRDLLRHHLQLDGLPITLVDTAGLRLTGDVVEAEGIRRAKVEMRRADRILWVMDASVADTPSDLDWMPADVPVTVLMNKIDLVGKAAALVESGGRVHIHVSAQSGAGLDLVRQHLRHSSGLGAADSGALSARRRHLDALVRARSLVSGAAKSLEASHAAELFAEDLRLAQKALGEITGEFSSDELLGEIFSSFCIGK